MSETKSSPSGILKVALKRADVGELLSDPLFQSSPLLKWFGGPKAEVFRGGALRRFLDGAVLFQVGDAGDSLFFVLEGEVRLFARRDTESVDLGTARRGDVVGEAEALTGDAKRSSSAVANGQVDVLELPRALLLRQGALPPPLAGWLRSVSTGRREALDELSDFLNRW